MDLTIDEDEEEEEVVENKKRPKPSACNAQSRSEEAGVGSSGKPQASDTQSRPPGARLQPGSYDIILCVDFIETTGLVLHAHHTHTHHTHMYVHTHTHTTMTVRACVCVCVCVGAAQPRSRS